MTRKDIKDRKKFGHNLERLLNKAVEFEINTISPISPDQMLEIKKANGWYARKGFEYFEIRNIVDGRETLPDPNILVGLAERLVVDLKSICLDAV